MSAQLPTTGMTISKSQGQTFKARVGVILTSHVWTHGLLYVALGRVTSPHNLRVWTPSDGAMVMNVRTAPNHNNHRHHCPTNNSGAGGIQGHMASRRSVNHDEPNTLKFVSLHDVRLHDATARPGERTPPQCNQRSRESSPRPLLRRRVGRLR
jgi:hypothetical protein